jgi:hypothetical protein
LVLSDSGYLNGQFHFRWAAQPGTTYRVQAKMNVNESGWTNAGDITATASTAEFSASGLTQGGRYYRIQIRDNAGQVP